MNDPASPVEAGWDSYVTLVDDEPALVLVGLHLEGALPHPEASTLCLVAFDMLDPGDGGTGSEAEAIHLAEVEEAIASRLSSAGFIQAGRVRAGGSWECSFYGSPVDALAFPEAVDAALARVQDARVHWTQIQPDPEWTYFRDLLLPDLERRLWMKDRDVVDALVAEGDPLETVRPVEHLLTFPSAEAAELFFDAVRMRGYEPIDVSEAPDANGGHRARLRRNDPVDLDSIHRIVMDLTELAAPYDGDHEGWETDVVEPSPQQDGTRPRRS